MSALPVHQTRVKVSQVTNIFLPSRILAINVVLYAAKAFKNEMKHMNAKACALFFTRYNNSTSSSQQHSVSLRSARIGNNVPEAANIQLFILTRRQQWEREFGRLE